MQGEPTRNQPAERLRHRMPANRRAALLLCAALAGGTLVAAVALAAARITSGSLHLMIGTPPYVAIVGGALVGMALLLALLLSLESDDALAAQGGPTTTLVVDGAPATPMQWQPLPRPISAHLASETVAPTPTPTASA